MSKLNRTLVTKVVLAFVLLSGLAGVAGSQLAPTLPLQTVLYYAACGAVAFVGLMVVALIIDLTFSQFILRNGGTDAQWFWFPGEPPGLQQLRGQTAAKAAKSKV